MSIPLTSSEISTTSTEVLVDPAAYSRRTQRNYCTMRQWLLGLTTVILYGISVEHVTEDDFKPSRTDASEGLRVLDLGQVQHL